MFWVKRRLRNYLEEIYHGDLWETTGWRENLRMSRQTFEIMCTHLRPAIERQDTRLRRAVPYHERLAVTLWKLATAIEYRTLGQHFGLGRSTISHIVHDTCTAICEILQPIYIKFPTGQRLNNIVQGYDIRWGFPQCVGAIDRMHVPTLMKPFAHHGVLNAAQRRFNYRHSRARMTIENTFGRLKARWRCLLKKNEFHLENIHRVVLSCCVLHNVCEIHNERLNGNWRQILAELEDNDPLRMIDQVLVR
jgi:hypothetical protein